MEDGGFFGFTKLQMLLLLRRKERSGYELMGEIGHALGKRPSAGQIYPLLAKMKKQGYVRIRSTGRREKKIYALTAKGTAALNEMVWKAGSIVEAVLADKLKECGHCGCMIYGKAYERKMIGKIRYFCCAHCAADEKKCENCG